jgi:hypothetical protein
MANINHAFGLSPVRTTTGAPWNEQGRLYAVANDASNSYAIGDVVAPSTSCDVNGVMYCTKWTSTAQLPLGVVVGIVPASDSATLQGATLSLETTYLAVSAGVRYVRVVDDPKIVMLVQADSTGIKQDDVGLNGTLTVAANQTTLAQSSPLSSVVLSHTTIALGTTGSLAYPLQIIGLSNKPNNAFGATAATASPYVEALVTWNQHYFGGPKTGTA